MNQSNFSAHSNPSKIQNRHWERLAVIYVRQSTMQQVLENKESTALQYALTQKAVALGWSNERVIVIDEDQGKSGQSAENRFGFQRLLAEISLDHVGLVLGIEMSRLARSSKDWHQLLELCALFQTLLGDQDGLYDPTHYNDRLLLGLKGTMSEAELHIIRARMTQGMRNKAKRGEMFNSAPMGYVRAPEGGVTFDPDQQVQSTVKLIFDKFDEIGSVNSLLNYLTKNKILMGIRPHGGPNRGNLEWRRPNRTIIQNCLNHPLYSGTYRWGFRAVNPRQKITGKGHKKNRTRDPEKGFILIPNRWPAYISRDRYQANLLRLEANRTRAEAMGTPREGPSLLGGLLYCGQCGCKMSVAYSGHKNDLRYCCNRNYIDYGEANCQSLTGTQLDHYVSEQILQVLQPASLKLCLATSNHIEKETQRLQESWTHKLERARYQSDRAHRQFQGVEPENRLVGRELEKHWEKALSEQRAIEEEYEQFQKKQSLSMSESDREQILALSVDLPKLWLDPHTSPADKQKIIRLLLNKVIITVVGQSELVDLRFHWVGDYISEFHYQRSVAKYEQLSNYEPLMQRLIELQKEHLTLSEIASKINQEGWRPPKQRDTFNEVMVSRLLSRRSRLIFGPQPRRKHDEKLQKGEWWFKDLLRELDISHSTLFSWLKKGWVNSRQLTGTQGLWIIWADRDELKRLRLLQSRKLGWTDRTPASELITPKSRPSA